MELGLTLGAVSKPFHKSGDHNPNKTLSFCMGLSIGPTNSHEQPDYGEDDSNNTTTQQTKKSNLFNADKLIQLDLLPFSHNGSSETESSGQMAGRTLDVNRPPTAETETVSSPNSAASSFQVGFCLYNGGDNKRDFEEGERTSSRASDDDENGNSRKKLRLSKEQSAFLEESFKEHNTLNPKQKIALAKQLNLRPRQVEVWFQNRRARTKLKQTEVDCEYLKRCCETLTEENRRLHRELQDLRTLKNSNPFYMQLPATTLTMCPSCERVATTSTTPAAVTPVDTASKSTGLSLTRPNFYPFSQAPGQK